METSILTEYKQKLELKKVGASYVPTNNPVKKELFEFSLGEILAIRKVKKNTIVNIRVYKPFLLCQFKGKAYTLKIDDILTLLPGTQKTTSDYPTLSMVKITDIVTKAKFVEIKTIIIAMAIPDYSWLPYYNEMLDHI